MVVVLVACRLTGFPDPLALPIPLCFRVIVVALLFAFVLLCFEALHVYRIPSTFVEIDGKVEILQCRSSLRYVHGGLFCIGGL